MQENGYVSTNSTAACAKIVLMALRYSLLLQVDTSLNLNYGFVSFCRKFELTFQYFKNLGNVEINYECLRPHSDPNLRASPVYAHIRTF